MTGDFFKIKSESHFKEVFDEFFPSLYYYALKVIQNESVAEDMVQEIFLDLWRKRDEVYIEKIANYLYSATRFKCMNHLRHEKVKRDYASKNISEDVQIDDSIIMIEEEMVREINKHIDSMPEQRKIVFRMHLDGLSQEEIANELNISVNTVKTHKLKARQYLRETLKNSLYILCLIKFDSFL